MSQSDVILGEHLELICDTTDFKRVEGGPVGAQLTVDANGGGALRIGSGASPGAVTIDDDKLTLADGKGDALVRISRGRGVTAETLAKTRVFIDGEFGNVVLGGHTTDGDVVLRDANGNATVHLSASLGRGEGNTVHPFQAPEANVRIHGMGKIELAGAAQISLVTPSGQTTVDLLGHDGRVQARVVQANDIMLGAGAQRIESLLDYIRLLEDRIRVLETSR